MFMWTNIVTLFYREPAGVYVVLKYVGNIMDHNITAKYPNIPNYNRFFLLQVTINIYSKLWSAGIKSNKSFTTPETGYGVWK